MASTNKLLKIILQLEDKFSKEIGKAAKHTESFSKNISKLGAGMTVGLTLPIVGLGIAATKTAIDMESAFAGVAKTVDASAEELVVLRNKLDDLATSGASPVAALENAQAQLYEIAEAAGQLGVKTKDIAEFSDVMGQLSMSTNIAGEEGARMVAQFANVAKMPLSDIRQFGDVIVTLGNNLATTENDILRFGQRMGTLSQVGFNPEDILAFGGALASMGVSAELGSTNFVKGVNNMAVALAKGGKGIEHVADAMGYSLEELRDHFDKDAAGAVLRFADTLRDLPLEKQVALLEDIGLTGTEAQQVFLKMAGNTELLTNALDMAGGAMQGNSALFDEASKRAETTAGQLNMLKNNLALLADQFGQVMLPILNQVIPVLTSLVQAFSGLPAPIKTIIVGFLGLVAVIGPVLTILGTIGSVIGAVSGAIGAIGGAIGAVGAAISAAGAVVPLLGLALAALTSPIAILIGSLVALKAAWDNNVFGIQDKVKQIPEVWGNNFKMLGEIVNTVTQKIGQRFPEVVKAFLQLGRNIIVGLANGIRDAAVGLFNTVANIAKGIQDRIRSAFKMRSPSKVMEKMGQNVAAGFQRGIQAMGGLSVQAPTMRGLGLATANVSRAPMVARAPTTSSAGMGGGNVYIDTINVPPGTDNEQIRYIMRKIGKEVKRRGGG